MASNQDQNEKSISAFYDEFKTKQEKTGLNIRHYMVFNHCLRVGLRSDHNILEIGCGIGTFTSLMAKFATKGKIVATDISADSVELAKRKLKGSKNTEFITSDMKDFKHPAKFDFVVMVDVLEHIPLDQYDSLFAIINAQTGKQAVLAMNIPHPNIIRWLRKYNPNALQIEDNPVQMDFLSRHLYSNGFRLKSFQPYSITHKGDDYVFMVFQKEMELKADSFSKKPKNKIRKNKLFYKFKYLSALLFNK
jgi:cyclopropane fatty-acyl-phospholipid synthase-like methyltransferase